jgi:hypothetical protein
VNFRELPLTLVRSITPVSLAIVFGLVGMVPILAATVTEIQIGRPGSGTACAIVIGVIAGPVCAFAGAAIGFVVWAIVRRTRWAGPADFRIVAIVALLSVGVSSGLAVLSVVLRERNNVPRVMTSTGVVQRSTGRTAHDPSMWGVLVWTSQSWSGDPVELTWNGQTVRVSSTSGSLIVSRLHATGQGVIEVGRVDLSKLDRVREVLGATAALDGTDEWLALLVQLRATGKREVLLIYDPAGKLMHQELLERQKLVAGMLWSAGSVGTKQEFVVDLGGEMVRFALKN